MKESPILWLLKQIDSVKFLAPECGDYYHEISKFFDAALEKERHHIAQSYSHGWHDGQDVIIDQIKHVDLGGDAAGLEYYKHNYKQSK